VAPFAIYGTIQDGCTFIPVREITPADLETTIDVLQESFPEQERAYWVAGLERLTSRTVPIKGNHATAPHPQSTVNGCVAGVLMAIWSAHRGSLICNLSSWVVLGRSTVKSTAISTRNKSGFCGCSPRSQQFCGRAGYRDCNDDQMNMSSLPSSLGWALSTVYSQPQYEHCHGAVTEATAEFTATTRGLTSNRCRV